MASSFKYLLIATLVVTLSACKFGPVKKRGVDGEQVDETQTAMADAEQGAADQRFGADMGAGFSGQELDDPNSPLSKRVFYFDLDSSQFVDDGEVSFLSVDALDDFLGPCKESAPELRIG